MPIAIRDILSAVESHVAASGHVEQVMRFDPRNPDTYEPINPAQLGVNAAIWVQAVGVVPAASGLDVVTGKVDVTVQLYTRKDTPPLELVDPRMVEAVDALFAAYCGDFTLGGLVSWVDLLGAHGQALEARAGFLTEDETLYRIYRIELPLVLADVWAEVA